MKRETVELVSGDTYWSDDHWVTVNQYQGRRGLSVMSRRVTDKAEADRIRFIATVQHGGGRNDARR